MTPASLSHLGIPLARRQSGAVDLIAVDLLLIEPSVAHFVNDDDELKAAIDGIYADMRGYRGHYDWRTFFAVFLHDRHDRSPRSPYRGI